MENKDEMKKFEQAMIRQNSMVQFWTGMKKHNQV
jgi:hypothetical protein